MTNVQPENRKNKTTSRRAAFLLVVFFCALVFCFEAFALNLETIKVYFLNNDYDNAIKEGEKLLAASGSAANIDELYYILGVSYLKDGNYLRASDIFEIILKEFKKSRFKEDAKLGLGDTYLLRGDIGRAEIEYNDILTTFSNAKLKAAVYYRLSQIELKKGNKEKASEYQSKIKQEYPLSPEVNMDKLLVLEDTFYTVQAGSFSKKINAQSFVQKLNKKGYPAYMEELISNDKIAYRVRVGKVRSKQEAEELRRKLSREGYQTKIFP